MIRPAGPAGRLTCSYTVAAIHDRPGGTMRVRRARLRGLLLAGALCVAGPAAAQDVPLQQITPTVAEPSATPSRDEAERIGHERWASGLHDSASGVETDGTTFRLNISAPQVNL